jgi:hypothetical protein
MKKTIEQKPEATGKKRVKKTTRKQVLSESKVLKAIQETNKLLSEIKEILDNIWRERIP